jgi:energy-coupling factor transporter ATP-binding protein EcfA2
VSSFDKIDGEPELEGDSEEEVLIERQGTKFCMDGYLVANLTHVIRSVTKKDYDCFIIVTGREGFGKSTLAGQVALFLDPTFNLDRCCFTADQFKEACEKAEKYQAIVFDETMGYLSSRGAMSSFNRDLIKVFSEMRSKNLFIILCIPNFFELDRYPAMHRATGLLYVYKRSCFGSYDYPTKKKLYLTGKKLYSYVVPPNFRGSFIKYFVYPKELYEQKKQNAINSWIKAHKNKEIAKKIDLSDPLGVD